jgi:hypothetical protein
VIDIRLGRRHVMEIENTVTRRDHKQQTGIINMDRNRMQINRNIEHLHRNIVMIKEGSVNDREARLNLCFLDRDFDFMVVSLFDL